jgi:N-acetylglucosaminyl-diphospho-decaprenol L-rhamnosyltransferase
VDAESLGVVVLAYGSGGEYAPLVGSLLEEGVAPGSILVVHNPAAPGEKTPEVPSGCEVLQAERNLGYAGGMNLGIARMRERGAGGLLLLLTHDARLRSGALRALIEAAGRRPDFGILAPALILTGTDTPFSFGGVTSVNGTTAHVKDPPAGADGVFACDWVDGGTMLIRREVLDRVGAFDERFWGYCEESDLCLRARRAGFGVGVVLAARADQDPGGAKRIGAWAYLLTRNGIEYAHRAAGMRGLVAIATRSAWLAAFNLLRAGLRVTRLRPGGAEEPWTLAVATARGTLDYFRGRWGPPPPDLPGMGDLRNA